ncbi:MAG: hypothetical protein AB1410_00485 [Acidobacteriota bacterium]
MNKNNKIVRIFAMPLQFPCGPESVCCGPIGQSDEEIRNFKESVEKELGVVVEVRNVMKGEDMRDWHQISGPFRSFRAMSLPIIAVEDEVATLQEKMKELEIQ